MAVLIAVAASIPQTADAAPTPTPTPTSVVRPFAAPVTSRTVTVPTSIDATGATNAGSALQTFINGVPDGSVIVFKAGGVYRLDRGIFVSNRHQLVFDGNGATVRAGGAGSLIAASPFLIDGANSDIVVRNFTIEGNNPRTGTDIYDQAGEDQQGVAIYGGSRIEITNNTIRKTWGDGIYANEKDTTHSWVDGLWVHANTFVYIGRNTFTMNGAKNAILERNTIDKVGGSVLDIEPDTSLQGVTNLTLRYNTIAVWGMSPKFTQHFVACANDSYGPGAVIRGVTITGNHVSQGAPNSVYTYNAGGLYSWIGKTRTSSITFTNNTTTKAGAGPVLIFEHVDGLTVTGNTQPLTSGSLVSIRDSTNVVRDDRDQFDDIVSVGLLLVVGLGLLLARPLALRWEPRPA
jgi:Right handed beta helix region